MLVAVGVNQKGANVSDRELLGAAGGALDSALAEYAALDGVEEVALLSTCYRIEIFATTRCPAAAILALRRTLQARAGRELPHFELRGEGAFEHLVRVASSLESAMLGEPQILGQVKDAFQRAVEVGTAGKELSRILGRALQIAKRVRTETALGRSGVSWGHAAAVLAGKVLGSLRGRDVAVIGAGEMARVAAQHLAAEGASIVVLDETLSSAVALAADVGGTARPLEALDEELLRADLVVSAARAVPDALRPEPFAATMTARRRRCVLVDLAIPRAVPEATGRVEDVYLCNVDDLDRVMRSALDERARAAVDAERIVAEEVGRWARSEDERRVRDGGAGEPLVGAQILDRTGERAPRRTSAP